MVSSKIDNKYNYKESKEVNNEDIGYSTSVYKIELFEIYIYIVLGKQQNTNLVSYYPIYIVKNDRIKSQIGIFEIELNSAISVLDEDGEPELENFSEPLLFSFVNESFIKKINSTFDEEEEKREEEEKKEEEENDLEEDDIFKVSLNKEIEEEEVEDIFIDEKFKKLDLLEEETDKDTNNIRKEYKESDIWVQQFLKNNNFRIESNEGSGNCFFYTIIEAYKSIGKKTTVNKLRLLLSNEITEEILENQKMVYFSFEEEKSNIEKELKNIKSTVDKFSKNIKDIKNTSEKEEIIIEAKKYKEIFKEKQILFKEVLKQQEEYVGFIKDIETLEDYKKYIKTSDYWADAWAISSLERLLNVKFIILSQDSYNVNALDNVLQCGESNNEIKESFNPEYYIMINFVNNNHFELIVYKDKKIFKFSEIPYSIKLLTVNKCLEKNSGIFNKINDFIKFKKKLGVRDTEVEEDDFNNLFNSEIVFVFHNKSDNSKKPGFGSGEKIDNISIKNFISLNKNKNWRRMLDDFYDETKFTIDNKEWCSVINYLEGSKYKKMNPDIFHSFSVDSDSIFSKNSDLAIKEFKKLSKNNKIKIDTDYNENKTEYRRNALNAKFEQNIDLKNVLLNTQNAKLNHFIRGSPSETDYLLMETRVNLQNNEK
jgi:predicted NAD-dependent protein-ADP-ribosyltransferase YbiA (DUF1768 family)